jgi:hypothetical protein
MCRLIAFPPRFPRKDAEELLWDMYGNNKDGTGSVYLRGTHFEMNKWPLSYEKVLKDNLPLFHHMPYDSWTVAHVRQKTHGEATVKNTHPFIKGKFAVVHNGVWSDSKLVRLVLKEFTHLSGETDSEVAAWLIAHFGPVDFYHDISGAGVYLALERDGGLWGINTSSYGDLEFTNSNYGCVIASELPKSWSRHSTAVKNDWVHFTKAGDVDRSSGHVLSRHQGKPKNKLEETESAVNPMMRSERGPSHHHGSMNIRDISHTPTENGMSGSQGNLGTLGCPWCPMCFVYHAPGVHFHAAFAKEKEEERLATIVSQEKTSAELRNIITNLDVEPVHTVLSKPDKEIVLPDGKPLAEYLKQQYMEFNKRHDWSERSYELESYQ